MRTRRQAAKQVLALDPPATAAERRTAWTVIAHTAFERGAFDRAETAYADVLALTPEQAPEPQRTGRATGAHRSTSRVSRRAPRAGA